MASDAMTQGRFALDQMVAMIRDELRSGISEEEIASDLAMTCMRKPEKAISLAVVAAIELAKRAEVA